MLSFGIPTARAFSIAIRSRKFASGLPPPWRAASMMSRAARVKACPFLASPAAFCRLIVLHLEWPDIQHRLSWDACSPRHDRAGVGALEFLVSIERFKGRPS